MQGPQQVHAFVRYLPLNFSLYFLSVWIFVTYVISRIDGWHLLAQRFRTEAEFTGPIYRWFNAAMRWGIRYNSALKVGTNVEGLYIAPLILFRMGHPPLFIPWSEISVGSSPWYDLFSITLTLGRAEQVPFRISRRTARKLRIQAGASWTDPTNLMDL
jgi:hypothetical protein